MKVILCRNSAEAADIAAGEILATLEQKPNLVLGLATGSTPCEVYSRLIQAHQHRRADFSRVTTFNLDEYLDLGPDHPQSYHAFMQQHLFSGLNVPSEQIHFPPAEGSDLSARCREFENKIQAVGGVDIQILGIGTNGHIGFNEPTSSLRSRTRIQTLTRKTLQDNSRFYPAGEFQPQMAATMGIGTILESRRILLQAFGHKKSEAIRAAIEGPVSSFCPASALQLHSNVTFLIDAEAASGLSMREFYPRARQNEEELRRAGRL